MKAKRALALVPVLALALAGCGGSSGGGNAGGGGATDADCAKAEVLCVGLVTDTGKVDDKSFNQSAWEGVQAAVKELGGVSKYVETTDTKDYGNNIKQFTDKKYDAIVTVGFLMADATAAAAKGSPDVKFIGVDQAQPEKDAPANYTSLVFPEDQAGYAAGVLAAKLTKTGKLAQVLGLQIPPVEKFAKGFEAGAKSVKSDIQVTAVYHPAGTNAFTDPVWGGNEAKKALAQGADVVFGAGGKTGNGALAEVAKASGAGTSVFCIGVDTDQWNTVPEAQKCLVTSAMKNITLGVTDLVKQVKAGSIKGGYFNGTTGLADYHDLKGAVPADVQTAVADVVKGLADGSLKTGVTL
ncbi:MAG: BMP family ABC transporter substrate-binding protein [Actinomycetales bacterium]|nr:BMP family ABC transporter substrate-binding protein [Candidatus Lutibacillus vidarii]